MTDTASMIATAQQRFSEIDTDILREMWATEERTEWAESALRSELLNRGVQDQELDAIEARRTEIAANPPLSARAVFWQYGFVGRVLTIASVAAWVVLVRSAGGSSAYAVVGALVVVGLYVFILTRRTVAQSKYPMRTVACFFIYWQLIEAWLIFIVATVLAVIIFAG